MTGLYINTSIVVDKSRGENLTASLNITFKFPRCHATRNGNGKERITAEGDKDRERDSERGSTRTHSGRAGSVDSVKDECEWVWVVINEGK